MHAKKAVSTVIIPGLTIKKGDTTSIAANAGEMPSTNAAKIVANLCDLWCSPFFKSVSIAFSNSFNFFVRSAFSVIYAPLMPDVPIAIDPATAALIIGIGSSIPAT